MIIHQPMSPEPTAVGVVSLRSQRRHEMVAPNETFATRTVVVFAIHIASRRWLSFFSLTDYKVLHLPNN
jgi:hypothetical protein